MAGKTKLIVFVASTVSFFANGQETRPLKLNTTIGLTEYVNVLVADTTVREGKYSATYNEIQNVSGQYRNGERSGIWQFYSAKGEPTYQYDFTTKQFVGSFKIFHDNGAVKTSVEYVNGEREGLQRMYSDTGRLIEECFFSKGKLNGYRTYYYSNSQINFRLKGVNGNFDSVATFFFDNGNIRSEIEYNEGKLVRVISLYDKTGKVLDAGTVTNGNGVRYIYYRNNSKKYSISYLNGLIHGPFFAFMDNGQKYISGSYRMGVPSGIWEFYTPEGEVFFKYDFNNNLILTLDNELRNKLVAPQNAAFLEMIASGIEQLKTSKSILFCESKQISGSEHEFDINSFYIANFPGGMDEIMRFLSKNISYPAYERKRHISGAVSLKFTINSFGEITNILPIKEVEKGPGLTKEAIRVLSNTPFWTPGLIGGKPEDTTVFLPVRFVLH